MSRNRIIAILVLAVLAFVFALAIAFLGGPTQEETSARLRRIKDLTITQGDCYASLEESKKLVKDNRSFAEGWQWKGVCEFQLGQYVEASESFKKALDLDPENQAAQNYLNVLGDDPASYYSLNDHKINEHYMNIKLGADFGGKILAFSDGYELPPGETYSEFVVANYLSSAGSVQTVNYVKGFFAENEYEKFSENDSKDQITLNWTRGKTNASVSVWKGDPVRASVSYILKK